ncbi:MAG: type II toxin-antitoxin system RelE/ParE family toxin [Verrucomicrobia bacterium]|nr:type II toxin-antitoxin system RelE/ParE family toxin [Verrucomicrobiota bacterium]
MIKSFADAETEKLFAGSASRHLPPDIQRTARRKLLQLDASDRLDIMRLPPGNRLEALKGSRRGQHSIRINDQWRLCFRWAGEDAHEVEIVDYH